MSKKYVTAKAIVIPEGTAVNVITAESARKFLVPYAEVTVGISPDQTAYWDMDLEEAIETGLVRAA